MTIVFFGLGLALLLIGSTFFVRAAIALARRFHAPTGLVAGTILALGTSLPELFITLRDVTISDGVLATGNLLGSNIANVFLILGFAIAFGVLPHPTRRFEQIGSLLIAGSMFLLLVLMREHSQLFGIGAITTGLVLIFRLAQRADIRQAQPVVNTALHAAPILVFGIAGLVALLYGSELLVSNAHPIAESLGLSEFLVGALLVAVGTSLPELATVAIALRQGQQAVALNTIISSNLINILLIGGAGELFGQLGRGVDGVTATLFLGSAVIAFLLGRMTKLPRLLGFAFLGCYILYVLEEVLK